MFKRKKICDLLRGNENVLWCWTRMLYDWSEIDIDTLIYEDVSNPHIYEYFIRDELINRKQLYFNG